MTQGEHVAEGTQDPVAAEQVSLGDATRDLGFAWTLFGTLVGTPSLISILQTIWVDQKLNGLPQQLIEEYSQALDALGNILEPYILPRLHEVGAYFDLDLALYPQWKPLAVLGLLHVICGIRTGLILGGRLSVSVAFAFSTMAAIIGTGCIAASVFPASSTWWQQGLVAAIFSTSVAVGTGIYLSIIEASFSPLLAARGLKETFTTVPEIAAIAFALGLALSFLPGVSSNAGLLASILLLLLNYIGILLRGIQSGHPAQLRASFAFLGGFAGTGLIYLADWYMN